MQDDNTKTSIEGHIGSSATKPSTTSRGQGETSGALNTGTRIESFNIVEVINEGAASILYLAYDHSQRRHVALREYMPRGIAVRTPDMSVEPASGQDSTNFDAGLRSFINEALVLNRTESASLVKVQRYWEAHRTAYASMPLYEGITLKQTVAEHRAPLNDEWIKTLVSDLLHAIEAVHRAQSCHGNISPGNILIRETGRPLLLEFDSAQAMIAELTQVRSGTLVSGFAPIELYPDMPDLEQGAWTDIYAVAAVAYYLIAGKPPPPATQRIVNDTMRPACEVGRNVYSDNLLAALDHALAVRPDERIRSVNAMRTALKSDSTVLEPSAYHGATNAREAIRLHREALAAQTRARGDTTMAQPSGMTTVGVEAPASHGRQKPMPFEKKISPNSSPPRRSAMIVSGIVLVAGIAAGLIIGEGSLLEPDANHASNSIAGSTDNSAESMDTGIARAIPPQQTAPAVMPPAPVIARSEEAAPPPARLPEARPEHRAEKPASDVPATPPAPTAPLASLTKEKEPVPEPAKPAPSIPATPTEAAKQKETAKIAAEREQWRIARNLDEAPAYEAYLNRFPYGANAIDARQRLAEIRLRSKVEKPQAQVASRPPQASETDRASSGNAAAGSAATGSASPQPAASQPTENPSRSTPREPDTQVASRTERTPPPASSPSVPSGFKQPTDKLPPPAPSPDAASATPRKTYKHADQTMSGDFNADPVTGLVSGTGRIVWNNGDRFDGTLVKGSKEGKGQFVWSNGQRYNGDWLRNEPNGRGTLVFANGNRYEGEVRNGLPDGRGVLIFSDGSRYEGQIRNGVPNGKGIHVFADGTRYEGDIRDGLPHGQGVTRFKNGDVYVGTVARGRSNGQGRFSWANGSVWEGEFRDGQRTTNGHLLAAGNDTPSSGGSQAARSEAGPEREDTDKAIK
ncbi:protein kinase domain-containing protein [Noviherbaspirillum saxi]|nr:hypothetical protein [Noviherbaspirillum saxi]